MRYVGGKTKIAATIASVLLKTTNSRGRYIEPFLGGGAAFSVLAPHFEVAEAGDYHPDLVKMWKAVLFEGWEPPLHVSESRYLDLKYGPTSAERGFVGFGGSFGGKWFGGYARGGFNSDGTPRNYPAESARAVLKIRDRLSSANILAIRHQSYVDWIVNRGDVVYCDPPYAETQKYSTGGFDHSLFWDTMRDWNSRGAHVFVSEYEAPKDWTCIWQREKRQTLAIGSENRDIRVEKLFTLR